MTNWTEDELDTIGKADEVQIGPLRPDGTAHRPVTIWVVRVGDDLYVRSWRGRDGGWFRAVRRTHAGHLHAGRVDRDVSLIEADPDINDAINAAYRTKYDRSSYLEDMVGTPARATTLKLIPRPVD